MASLLIGALPIPSQSLRLSPRLSFSHSETLGISVPSLNSSLSIFATSTPPSISSVYCGRGDKKTARGKRFNHSYGNARPRNKSKGRGPPKVACPPAPPRKDKFDDNEKIKIDIDESLFSN